MASVKELLNNPYEDVDISLLIPSIDFNNFSVLYRTLIDQCVNPEKVEMLIKLDNISDIDKYYELCSGSPFRYKILIYPKYNSRCTLHVFFNDLGYIASGKIIWILNDDASVTGKWDKVLLETRDSYNDNIYAVIIPYDNGKGTEQIIPLPAITKEWIHLFGNVTKFPNFDRWIDELSKGINRRVVIKESDLFVSMPTGRRVLSKEDRKTLFYPAVEKSIKRARKKLEQI